MNASLAAPAPDVARTALDTVGQYAPVFAHDLEAIEAEVWGGLYRLATPDDVAACGLGLGALDGATMLAMRHVDVLALNRAVGLGADGPVTDDTLDALVRWYADAGVPRFFVQLNPSAEADLAARLEARGFARYNRWAKLCRSASLPPAPPTDLRVRRGGPEHAGVVAAIAAPVFGWPEAVGALLARAVGQPGWRHYLAYDGDEPVAAAALYVRGALGALAYAATRPEHRGRGAQQALIARRITDAAALGCRLVVAETGEDRLEKPSPSYRNMRRMGFRPVYLRPNYLLTRAA